MSHDVRPLTPAELEALHQDMLEASRRIRGELTRRRAAQPGVRKLTPLGKAMAIGAAFLAGKALSRRPNRS